jgi:hypothetical protein
MRADAGESESQAARAALLQSSKVRIRRAACQGVKL